MKIAVVGLGLIGGSIFKRLKREGYDVIGISSSQQGDSIYSEYSFLADADVVFVAVPMKATLKTLHKVAQYVTKETIVTEVSSVKNYLEGSAFSFKFIPSHPMAGTENFGFINSFPELFDGAKWVITPVEDGIDTSVLELLIKRMGAIPVYMSIQEHDKAVATISHLPMLISQALFKQASNDESSLKLAASGFRDMTRLAMSNVDMATDMIDLNSDNIQEALLRLYSTIGDLLGNYTVENLADIVDSRRNMYKDGKNIL